MNDPEFYKDLYFKELERSDQILNLFNIPMTLLTILSSGCFYFITNFDYSVGKCQTAFFLAFITGIILCLIYAMYFLIVAYGGFSKSYEYNGLSDPHALNIWKKELETYYEKYFQDKAKAEVQFQDFIRESMFEITQHNMEVNDEKHRLIYRSKKSLVYALILSLITLVPFGYNYFNKEEKIQKIELVENNKS
jgi:hypothetical protein